MSSSRSKRSVSSRDENMDTSGDGPPGQRRSGGGDEDGSGNRNDRANGNDRATGNGGEDGDGRRAADRRERKKMATREALRNAAIELFIEKGFPDTTVRDITDRADLGSRTFYRHFESKEDLVLEDVRAYFADAEAILRSCPIEWSPIRSYFEVIDQLREKWSRDDAELSFLYDLVDTDPVLNGRFYYELMQHHGRVSELYAERLGIDRWDRNLWALATAAVDGFVGGLVMKVRGDSSRSEFDHGEEIILKMAEGLDPQAAIDRRKARSRR